MTFLYGSSLHTGTTYKENDVKYDMVNLYASNVKKVSYLLPRSIITLQKLINEKTTHALLKYF